jgi:hypothetical protein
LYQVIRDEFRALRKPRGSGELAAELRRLGIPSDRRAPAVQIVEQQGARVRLMVESEPGVSIEATLHLPRASGRRPGIVLVKDGSSGALAETAAGKGHVALEVAPRDSPRANDNRPFLGNWMANARADSIGRNLAAMRAHDILRGVDLLCSRDDVDARSIRGVAREVRGVWLLLAAAMDERIARVWLDRTPHSLAAAMDRPFNTNLFDALIPGFLLHWDLADLARAVAPRPLLWTDPADWMGRTTALGGGFRYRYSGEGDDAFLAELLMRQPVE